MNSLSVHAGRWTAHVAVLAVVLTMMVFGAARAQQYRIGPEDVLEIRYWQSTDLNSQVRVALDGTITLDIIGQISVAGKTTDEVQNEIARQISRLNKDVSQAAVRVVEYNYQHVYVTGQVATPGKHSFEEIPDLWSIINEAGGTTPTADLTRVTIVRGSGDNAGQVEIVNVAQAIATGALDQLPGIERKDRIEVPQNLMGLMSPELGQGVEKRSVIYVMGAVTNPGQITYQENIDILEAIALAGGPVDNADLKKAKIVSKDGLYAQAVTFDLEKYTTSGHPNRYIMNKEDAIYIPPQRGNFLTNNLGTIAAGLGLITSALLIYDQVQGSDNQ